MTARKLLLAIFLVTISSSEARALSSNTFGASLFLGDSYMPNNYRLSYKTFDLGFSDQAQLYAGSRLWKDNFYAGFGFGSALCVYGLVGYEWRFISWMGLSAEFDGITDARGTVAGRVYLGIVAGW